VPRRITSFGTFSVDRDARLTYYPRLEEILALLKEVTA
jgi:hypothetical protein